MPRNASGVYTLPAGNPVVPGTTIDASWANDTMEDLGTEITNSLSRTGAGGMLAPFRLADGAVTGPGVAFLNETNSGLYRSGAGSLWMSVLGVNTVQFSTVGVTIPAGKSLTAQGNASVSGTLAVTGAATFASTAAFTGAITATGGVLGNVTGNVSGNAGTVTNGVYTTGSYADPAWITSLAGSKVTGNISGNSANVTGTVAIANGGTGATTAGGARTALDVPSTTGSGATGTWNIDVLGNAGTVTNGVYTTGSYSNPSWITALAASKLTGQAAVANGGTGASTAAGARTAILPSYTSNALKFLRVNSGGTDVEWATESGVGTVTSVDASGGTTGLSFTGGPITGSGTLTLSGTLAVANGGTGSTTASAARTALGLAIGTDVQAYSANLTTWAGKTVPSGTVVGTSDTQTLTNKTLSTGSSWNGNLITTGYGGTGLSSFTANAILYAGGTTSLSTSGDFTYDGSTITSLSSSSYYPQFVQKNKAADANSSYVVFDKDRNSAIVQSGDNLGNIVFRGYDGSSYLQAASIVAYSDATPGSNDMPGALAFLTTADGASSPTERLRFSSAGAWGLAGANYGTSGQVLTSNGSGSAPTWQSVGGTGTVTSVATGTGLTGGPITTTGTISLANTAVTAGSYTNADITVDAQGRITAASNGTSSGITAGKSIAFAMVFGG